MKKFKEPIRVQDEVSKTVGDMIKSGHDCRGYLNFLLEAMMISQKEYASILNEHSMT